MKEVHVTKMPQISIKKHIFVLFWFYNLIFGQLGHLYWDLLWSTIGHFTTISITLESVTSKSKVPICFWSFH